MNVGCMRCPCSSCSLHVPPRLPCHRSVGTRSPGSPHHLFHAPHIRTLALLHRYLNELSDHQNVAVAPFPLSLSWHLFSFPPRRQMLHNALVNIFIKLLKTCICHPHHDNNFKYG